MSDDALTDDRHSRGGDAAAYVLGALEPEEAEAFRHHMDTCASCRHEVVALQQVADALPLASPQQRPPRRLKRKVMRSVRSESRGQAPAPRAMTTRLALGRYAAVAGLVLVLIAGALVVGLENRGGASRVIQARVTTSGAAQLHLAGDHAKLFVHRLPAPRAGRVYEVWLKPSRGVPRPAGALFRVPSSGSASVGLPGSLHGISALMVTEEPAGGSRAPTGSPVIIAQLS
jgi:anti-sigma-K factor RskA